MGRRKRWVKTVGKTVTSTSTKTPPGLFGPDAATISRTLTLPGVSPKGPVSGLRMRSFFIDRAGHQLTGARRAELEKAKRPCSRGSQQTGANPTP